MWPDFGSVVLEAPIVEREIEHSRGFKGVDRQAYGNAIGDFIRSTVRKFLGGDNALPQVFDFIVWVPRSTQRRAIHFDFERSNIAVRRPEVHEHFTWVDCVSKVRVLKGHEVLVVNGAECVDDGDVEGDLEKRRVILTVGLHDLGGGGVGLVYGLGAGVDRLVVVNGGNDEIFRVSHDKR
jgi:hypothetical protein